MYHKKHLRAAWAGGVTTLITPPWGPGLVLGLSAAFSTTPAAVTIDGVRTTAHTQPHTHTRTINNTTRTADCVWQALIGTNGGSAALHLSLGDATKGGGDTCACAPPLSPSTLPTPDN
jgi:hypothetical protein